MCMYFYFDGKVPVNVFVTAPTQKKKWSWLDFYPWSLGSNWPDIFLCHATWSVTCSHCCLAALSFVSLWLYTRSLQVFQVFSFLLDQFYAILGCWLAFTLSMWPMNLKKGWRDWNEKCPVVLITVHWTEVIGVVIRLISYGFLLNMAFPSNSYCSVFVNHYFKCYKSAFLY